MAAGLLRIKGASQIVQICKNGERVLRGKAMKEIVIFKSEKRRSVGLIADNYGNIIALNYDDILDSTFSQDSFNEVIDADGCCVLPGLVDAHTHPVWSGDRVHEFSMKLAGATYMEIHERGGGIHYTVNCTRQSTSDELYQSLNKRLWTMLRYGTTTVETKSGYGLNTESEVKMLQVLKRANEEHPISLSITYCGAHAVPKGMSSEEATQSIIEEQIPYISTLCSSGDLHVDNIDVFCEKGVFDRDQSRKILAAGKKEGWLINFHGDELNPMQSGELAGELQASAVSHLEHISDNGILSMVQSSTVGVLLPTTAYILRIKPPPARKMIDNGMAIALGSDFNPNAYCMSMPIVMHLACVNLHLTMEEALVACTINAAASIGMSDKCGSLEVGKKADVIVLTVPCWEHLIYQFGCIDQIIRFVIKDGIIVCRQ